MALNPTKSLLAYAILGHIMPKQTKRSTTRPAKKVSAKPVEESDSSYVLKLVMYLIVSSFWLRLAQPIDIGIFTFSGFPVGLCVGILLVSRDPFPVDRKIGYALVIIIAILSAFLRVGIII